jgi:hypothetical protein
VVSDDDDSPAFEQISLEALVYDPTRGMHVESR